MIEPSPEPRQFVCEDCKRSVVAYGPVEDDLCTSCRWVREQLKSRRLKPSEEAQVRRRLGIEKR